MILLTCPATATTVSFDYTLYGTLGQVTARFSGTDVDGDGWISDFTEDVIDWAEMSATMYDAGLYCDDEGNAKTCSKYDLTGQASLSNSAGLEVKADLSVIRMYLAGYENFSFHKDDSRGGASAELVYYGRYMLTKSFSINGWNTEPMPPAVPLPASGWMLMSLLIPVFALRYRRRIA